MPMNGYCLGGSLLLCHVATACAVAAATCYCYYHRWYSISPPTSTTSYQIIMCTFCDNNL